MEEDRVNYYVGYKRKKGDGGPENVPEPIVEEKKEPIKVDVGVVTPAPKQSVMIGQSRKWFAIIAFSVNILLMLLILSGYNIEHTMRVFWYVNTLIQMNAYIVIAYIISVAITSFKS